MQDGLSKALGIENVREPLEPNEIVVVKKEAPILTTSDIPDKNDIKEDYILARNTFRELIRKGTDALNGLEKISKEAETPHQSARVAEVISTLMKTVSETTRDMFALQKMTKELSGESGKKTETPITVDKAVFVGTTSDLLKKVKSEQQ